MNDDRDQQKGQSTKDERLEKGHLPLRSGGELSAIDQEIGEHFFVTPVSRHAAIVRLEFAASSLHASKEAVEFRQILVADERWLSDETAISFEIYETDGPIELEFQFSWIQQMKDSEVMLSETDMLKRAEQFFGFMEEIREDCDQRPRADFFRQIVQGGRKVGFTFRFGLH